MRSWQNLKDFFYLYRKNIYIVSKKFFYGTQLKLFLLSLAEFLQPSFVEDDITISNKTEQFFVQKMGASDESLR